MKSVIILRGVSGSGKSTLAEALKTDGNAVVVTADLGNRTEEQWKYSREKLDLGRIVCFELFLRALVEEKPLIVVDNTNTLPKHFAEYVEAAKHHGYKVFYLVVENRNNTRDVHTVPNNVLEWQYQNLRNNIILR